MSPAREVLRHGVDALVGRLHCAGWSISGAAATDEAGGPVWGVSGSDGEDLILRQGPAASRRLAAPPSRPRRSGCPVGQQAGRAHAGFSGVGPWIDRHPATIALRAHQGHQPKRPPGVSRGPLFEAGEGFQGRGAIRRARASPPPRWWERTTGGAGTLKLPRSLGRPRPSNRRGGDSWPGRLRRSGSTHPRWCSGCACGCRPGRIPGRLADHWRGGFPPTRAPRSLCLGCAT